ncbi:alpha/beta hydrolase [Leeia aquatica]|uniref:Carboxylesterase n=1 Tax=Leeia aquatica TaxID=2725557 RepID=A0A847SDT7_9NEIS|nr:carboxylesterase [Leeia aquatica]NLR75338.1 carboxylesterase [Leeia aquatica]
MTALLPAVEIEPTQPATHSIIWMHGLGADGHDFEPIADELPLPAHMQLRFVFPHAPAIPVTINNGYVMRAWYDILDFSDLHRTVDEAGITRSRHAIEALVAREIARGIPSERIFLAGFSQGGVMAYNVGLSYPQKLAGIIALSTYLPNAAQLDAQLSPANQHTPVFAAHGTLDPVVNLRLGDVARQHVTQLGHPVSWHTYPMQHSVCMEEVQALGRWLGEHA